MTEVTVYWTVRHTGRPVASVTNPGEIVLSGNGPGFEILRVLRNGGKRHDGWMVVLPGLVTELSATPERLPTRPDVIDERQGGSGAVVRGEGAAAPVDAVRGHLFGD